jgi:pyruvate/2-oxoglutarate dehydrogenase complex dihydrolipoamide acyltransferase (E2) component
MSEFKYSLPRVRPAHEVRHRAGRLGDGLSDVLPENRRAHAAHVRRFQADHDRHEVHGRGQSGRADSSFNRGKNAVSQARAAESADESESKKFPVALVVVLVLVLAAGAGVFLLRGKLFKSSAANPPPATNAAASEPAAPARCAVASDANWTNDLSAIATPDAPAAGRIHGRDFLAERAYYQNGVLTLRQGVKGPMEFGLLINFNGATPEALVGQTINVTSDTEKPPPSRCAGRMTAAHRSRISPTATRCG